MSDHVIAGNKYLRDFALKYNTNLSILPTCIDTDKYRVLGVPFYKYPKDNEFKDNLFEAIE